MAERKTKRGPIIMACEIEDTEAWIEYFKGKGILNLLSEEF